MSDSPRAVPVFKATVNELGQLLVRNPAKWRGYLARFKGRDMIVRAEPERYGRSLKANSYLWICYTILAEWSGHEPEEIHEALKSRLLPKRQVVLKGTGEVLEIPGSTRLLDSVEFADYVSKVKRFAAECGCFIPDSDSIEVAI
jgi:hypothetical protein